LVTLPHHDIEFHSSAAGAPAYSETQSLMFLVVIAWMYVVLMMAIVEATSSTGSLLGALLTFVIYGLLPLSIVMYLLLTPARRRVRQQQAAASSAADPDGGGHAPGDAVAPVREEP